MDYQEIPLFFDCKGATLVGMLTRPDSVPRVGVLIVVGGPQYRVGSHRQFVLLARALASAGIACMRFDYRGMGDSEGDPVRFDATGPDVGAAIETFAEKMPNLGTIVLWGLCDGAAACALARPDLRVGGMILVNPWVRTEATAAEATLRHYYAGRIFALAFWRKLAIGGVDFAQSLTGLLRTIRRAGVPDAAAAGTANLPGRFGRALARHRGPVLVMLSGNDQTAEEFRLAVKKPGPLRSVMQDSRVTQVDIAGADHTLSTADWRDRASALTLDWLRRHFFQPGAASS